MTVRYVVSIPTIAGQNVCFPSRHLADREAANARRQGHEATVQEVLVRS